MLKCLDIVTLNNQMTSKATFQPFNLTTLKQPKQTRKTDQIFQLFNLTTLMQ